ncbi:MAG: glycogen/starch/alpha-glucan phosphorylase [Thermodesulfobacteriota bacterium]
MPSPTCPSRPPRRRPADPPAISELVAVRPGQDDETMARIIFHNILSFLGRDPERASSRECCMAVIYALRDVLVEKWIQTQKSYYARARKRVYYLSMEFLIGRSLGNSLVNLGLDGDIGRVLEKMGFLLEEVREAEEEAGLGNGGLGRLAACFLDSIATLGIPAYGYGIRYEFGLFHQRFVNGYQVENPDNWRRAGSPWEFERPHHLYPVHFGGRVQEGVDRQGRYQARWVDTEVVMAMACDLLVPGFRNDNVINMRLWAARASRELDLAHFHQGQYIAAVEDKAFSETISKVLYPTDHVREGQELRLKQQYFFVAATFYDIFRRYQKQNDSLAGFPDEVAIQLNDTHPAIAIPELMRLLVDQEGLGWDEAWGITVRTFAYTNHTLMPEALETWPVELLGRILPRHLGIIYEINRRFLGEVARAFPGDPERLARMSLILEGPEKRVRMAHLAIVGSHKVNGVARLHTELLKTHLFADFAQLYPDRFTNMTNGITPRRWLRKANPGLAALISSRIGDGWVTDLDQLRALASHAADPAFQDAWAQVKLANKEQLARLIASRCRLKVDPASLFDVQVKRIHEYKRQLLNILHVVALCQRLLDGAAPDEPPRVVIFAGKAAPSYQRAKLIIKLVHSVAETVNRERRLVDRLRVVFLPNYGVALAEKIIPAAELSEQISTAGTEASGTGNMKLALNGALTIGTLDGANVEILEEVGRESFFLFGLTAVEVEEVRRRPDAAREAYARSPILRRALDAVASGAFNNGDPTLFRPLVASLLDGGDPYLHCVDFADYCRAQAEAAALYRQPREWTRRSILTTSRMGHFSSDRTVSEYARQIWGVEGGLPEGG